MTPSSASTRSLRPHRVAMGAAAVLGVLVLATGGWLGLRAFDASARLFGDDSVRFDGTFPQTPATGVPRFRIDEVAPTVTDEALASTFGFAPGTVRTRTGARGRVEYTSPALHGGGLARRLVISAGPENRPAVVEFLTFGGSRADVQRGSVATGSATRRAEALVTDAVAALGLDADDWSIEAAGHVSRSGTIWVRVAPLVATPAGPLHVGGHASGLAEVSRTGDLQGLSLRSCSFTHPTSVDLVPAEDAWRRYSHHGADEVPSGDPASYDDVELALAVFGGNDDRGREGVARPAWIFRGDGLDALVLSADSAAGRLVAGETNPLPFP